MFCPFCSHQDTKVLESRITDNAMRRRRQCLSCVNRFTTYEKAVFQLTVVKKDGREEPFNLTKIQHSIEKACSKTDTKIIESLTKKVEQKIFQKKLTSIKTTAIGKIVLQELKKFDKIVYLRYTSVYKSIDNPLLLKKELNAIV